MEVRSRIYEALKAPERRIACEGVAASPASTATLQGMATYVAGERAGHDGQGADGECRRRIRTRLHHVHLPKLADAEVLQYETDSQRVRPGPKLPVAIDLLQACAERFACEERFE